MVRAILFTLAGAWNDSYHRWCRIFVGPGAKTLSTELCRPLLTCRRNTLLSFLSNAAAWEPWQGNTVLGEATLRDDPADYKLHEGMWKAKLTLKLWSSTASVTAGSCWVSRGLGNKMKKLHLQNYLLYSEAINKHARASTFQTKVYSSWLLAIMIKIILCASNRGANLRKKKILKTWEYYNEFSLTQTLWSRHPYLHITEAETLAWRDCDLPRARQEAQGTAE